MLSEKHPYELRSQASPQHIFYGSLVLKGTVSGVSCVWSVYYEIPNFFTQKPSFFSLTCPGNAPELPGWPIGGVRYYTILREKYRLRSHILRLMVLKCNYLRFSFSNFVMISINALLLLRPPKILNLLHSSTQKSLTHNFNCVLQPSMLPAVQ